MTPITIASRSSRAEITAISAYLAYAGRQTDRRTKLKAKPNETRRTSCSGRGLHCVSCAICASSWPCTLEETGGTLISPGSPLNPRLRGSQTFHKKTSRNSSKLLFPAGSFAVHLPSTRRAFTPPMQPENLLRYRCPKNRAPQPELQTTTKQPKNNRGSKRRRSPGERKRARPRNRSRGVTSPRARALRVVKGSGPKVTSGRARGLTGSPRGCTFGPARSLAGGPVSTARGRSLAGRGLPCCAGYATSARSLH